MVAKISMKVLRRPPGVRFPAGTGSRNFLVTRPLAWVSILVCLGLLWLLYRRRRDPASAGDAAGG